ncbi:uncharacterized protein CTRU02_215515 [Colletotrichum truncatum]|uniref:Uncharacterized protein n=1 Tax=Colletotrichum truncatum TaxID=5467 RepID=A0ACC3YCN9_COLTU|nr:uncharacterized protein CTRU02_05541 [Colletotrichum truncatum]KAF6793984.1 hypothetical protein CTRU02_05541 [Colletotrichum truncatum]
MTAVRLVACNDGFYVEVPCAIDEMGTLDALLPESYAFPVMEDPLEPIHAGPVPGRQVQVLRNYAIKCPIGAGDNTDNVNYEDA